MAPIANWYDHNKSFWETYVNGRPRIPDNFFKRIFDYHAAHGGAFDLVHEPGAGVGMQSPRLAERFKRVVVTDPSDQNIAIAKQHLTADQYDIRISKLEDVPDTFFDLQSDVDFVFCATMLHWTQIDPAMKSIAYQLKPGGTFVAFNCGNLHLLDPEINKAWTPVISSETSVFFRKKYEESTDKEALVKWAAVGRSAYDAVPLDPELFENVQRVKLNFVEGFDYWKSTVGMFLEDLLPRDLIPKQIRPEEKVWHEEVEGWEFEGGLDELWAVVETFPVRKDSENLKQRWKLLEKAVQDAGGTVKGVWPVSLVMATRK